MADFESWFLWTATQSVPRGSRTVIGIWDWHRPVIIGWFSHMLKLPRVKIHCGNNVTGENFHSFSRVQWQWPCTGLTAGKYLQLGLRKMIVNNVKTFMISMADEFGDQRLSGSICWSLGQTCWQRRGGGYYRVSITELVSFLSPPPNGESCVFISVGLCLSVSLSACPSALFSNIPAITWTDFSE